MSFKIVLLPPYVEPDWPEKIERAVPGSIAKAFSNPEDALEEIKDADAAYGTVPSALFAQAKRLRWIAASRAGLGASWFYDALVKSDVLVTNMRGIYNEHLAAHVLAFVLAFARRFDYYLPQKAQGTSNRQKEMIDLASTRAMIVGVGGAGSEAARLCAAFGMRVTGVDPRTGQAPPGMADLVTPDKMDGLLEEADFVILTTPETPETRGMFDARRFSLMKRGAFFINIGRGACVVTDDLVEALRSGQLAGAGLDVVSPEPLPADHPLRTMPSVLWTPHVAIVGAPRLQEKREAILLENCRRFGRGEPLLNVVDKVNWY